MTPMVSRAVRPRRTFRSDMLTFLASWACVILHTPSSVARVGLPCGEGDHVRAAVLFQKIVDDLEGKVRHIDDVIDRAFQIGVGGVRTHAAVLPLLPERKATP